MRCLKPVRESNIETQADFSTLRAQSVRETAMHVSANLGGKCYVSCDKRRSKAARNSDGLSDFSKYSLAPR